LKGFVQTCRRCVKNKHLVGVKKASRVIATREAFFIVVLQAWRRLNSQTFQHRGTEA
jgi:hypothetical protein